MTANSAAEQASAGLLSLSDDEYDRFLRLNADYRERFGFPFIIAVRRYDKASLLAVFQTRLANPRAVEIETALAEIFTITRLRLDALFGQPTR
jgi:2-oxo-4-hydroxy-4-carboxy-5-ureidoimidazoline decarboxylase